MARATHCDVNLCSHTAVNLRLRGSFFANPSTPPVLTSTVLYSGSQTCGLLSSVAPFDQVFFFFFCFLAASCCPSTFTLFSLLLRPFSLFRRSRLAQSHPVSHRGSTLTAPRASQSLPLSAFDSNSRADHGPAPPHSTLSFLIFHPPRSPRILPTSLGKLSCFQQFCRQPLFGRHRHRPKRGQHGPPIHSPVT